MCQAVSNVMQQIKVWIAFTGIRKDCELDISVIPKRIVEFTPKPSSSKPCF